MKKMTEKALLEAFAGESMAHMKYLIFSEIAEKEGMPNIARLFKAIAYAEQV
ncbi:MAG: ferritin family protein, partial [candidate division WOR-3 bacterium]